MSFYFFSYLTNIVQLKLATYGLLGFFTEVTSGIFNIIMGILTDMTVSEIGRRKVYILISAFMMPLSFSLFFVPVPGSKNFKIFYHFITAFMFYFFFTMLNIPHMALLMDKKLESKVRDLYTTAYSLLYTFGAISGPSFLTVVMTNFYYKDKDKPLGYMFMSAITGAITILCAIIVYFGNNEEPTTNHLSICESIKHSFSVFKNKVYILILVIFISNQFAVNMMSINLKIYVEHVLREPSLFILAITLGIGLCLIFVPLMTLAINFIDKSLVFLISDLIYIVALLSTTFIHPETDKSKTVYLVYLSTSASVGTAATNYLPFLFLMDVVIKEKNVTPSREGAYSAMFMTGQKFTIGCLHLCNSIFLNSMGGFERGENGKFLAKQSNKMVWAIIGVTGVGPAIGVFIGMIAITLYYFIEVRQFRFRCCC